MLEAILFETQLFRTAVQRFCDQRAYIPHFFFAAAQADEIQQLRRIRQRIPHLLLKICIRILPDGDVVDVVYLRSRGIETGLNRQRRKSRVVLHAVEPFLGNRKQHFPVLNNGG